MSEYIEVVKEYWDKRYSTEGKIWGEKPSITAYRALEIFRKANFKSILVPGSGYGRHTMFFSNSGFEVTGIEISPVAIKMARQFDPLSYFYNASVLDMSFEHNKFDAIYCFNVLHLFRENERGIFIRGCGGRLKKNGLMFFTVFSEKEEDFGKGVEVEKNTFESRPGRPAHCFTEDDLRQHFAKYIVNDIGIIKDPEDHGGKPHIHILRYICVGLSI
jgi:2-polyprenyl-3-methyl-5-hydroxy-6-metoxy-1,4-benzoquinol methylase